MHQVIEANNKYKSAHCGEDLDVRTLLDMFKKKFVPFATKVPGIFRKKSQEDIQRLGNLIVSTYRYYLAPDMQARWTEKTFTLNINNCVLTAKIDVISDAGDVRDYKILSNRNLFNTIKDDLQLSIIAMMFRLHFGEEEKSLGWDVVCGGVHAVKIDTTRTQDDLKRTVERIEKVAYDMSNFQLEEHIHKRNCAKRYCLHYQSCKGIMKNG